MLHNLTVNLSDLLHSVSEAMDLSDASLVDHQIRTAYVSSQLARLAGLDYSQTERLFVAALLHDIGALTPEEKIDLHNFEDASPELHCQRGGMLFRQAFWLAPSAQIIEWHHTPMEVHKRAGRTLVDADVLASQILLLADHLERAIQRDAFILHQTEMLCSKMFDLAGRSVDPAVLDLFERVSASEEFWLELVSKCLSRQLRDHNLLRSIELDYEATRSIAVVLKDVTDFRSHFTATHSTAVAACARGIGQVLAFTGRELQEIDMAGLLHDIGKAVIPNTILCKPTVLSAQEYAIVKQHPYYTYLILSRIHGFEKVAEWAGFHHERNDGSGYPRRLERDDLDVGAKIIAIADVATAISEPRPYRQEGDKTEVLHTLFEMAKSNLVERSIVEALADNYELIMACVEEAKAANNALYLERYALETYDCE